MANTVEPTPQMEQDWAQWVAGRPPRVREVARRFFPWKLYRMKSTGHRVLLQSFGEAQDGSVKLTVAVLGLYNLIDFERQVFGIDPDDLSECDLPAKGEELGARMTQAEVAANLDEERLRIRPDLWTRLPDGSVVRKDAN